METHSLRATAAARRIDHPMLLLIGSVLLCAGLVWLWTSAQPIVPPVEPLQLAGSLTTGTALRMDSPAFVYSPGWRVTAAGADPAEPADPWTQPAGTVEFQYHGRLLALLLAVGDYWSYLYVTVDGAPANLLAELPGNRNSRAERAGYRPLYAPELEVESGPGLQWVPLHAAKDDGPHRVSVEIWRGWGQRPLRGAAVDLSPPTRPRWPAVLLLVLGTACCLSVLAPSAARRCMRATHGLGRWAQSFRSDRSRRLANYPAAAGITLLVLGVKTGRWEAALPGLALLSAAALVRPALWTAALLAGLPFYFAYTLPLLPGRSVSLIDVGVFGGLVLLGGHACLARGGAQSKVDRSHRRVVVLTAAIAGWALVSTAASANLPVALHEWRTVFLAGTGFALLLAGLFHLSPRRDDDRQLLVTGWLAGATVVALIGMWHLVGGEMTIRAEGVQRIRSVYGSPNNLAIYLERTLALAAALALFGRPGRLRVLSAAAGIVQGVALLFTFSKGALLLGLPAMLIVLGTAGVRLRRATNRSAHTLRLLGVVAFLAALLLAPFFGTDRFQNLFDLSRGTGFLRLQLWRSAWQMALDHPLLGVGPDNFLYAYRSGYLLPAAWQEPNLNHPHTWLLDWWTRLGLPGLALGLAFWGNGLCQLWRGAGQAGETQAPMRIGLLAAAVAALLHGLIDISYALPDLMLVWVLLFMLGGSEPTGHDETEAPP